MQLIAGKVLHGLYTVHYLCENKSTAKVNFEMIGLTLFEQCFRTSVCLAELLTELRS